MARCVPAHNQSRSMTPGLSRSLNHPGRFVPGWFHDSEGTQEVQKLLLFSVLKIVVFVDDGICFGCNSAVIRPTELW